MGKLAYAKGTTTQGKQKMNAVMSHITSGFIKEYKGNEPAARAKIDSMNPGGAIGLGTGSSSSSGTSPTPQSKSTTTTTSSVNNISNRRKRTLAGSNQRGGGGASLLGRSR